MPQAGPVVGRHTHAYDRAGLWFVALVRLRENNMASTTRLLTTMILAMAAIAGLSGAAFAQAYPSKPIHIVVPYSAGGITDVIARALAQRLTEAWGQQVLVENKPAAGGIVGTESVAKAAPDGYTLLVGADAAFVTAPHTYSRLPYDPVKDFVPITGLGISPQALIVNPSVPVHSLAELISYGKTHPGELNYGTFGIGTSGHLNIVLLESLTGATFTAVHYRGATPALTDTIGGHIQMMIVSIGLVASPWQAGKLTVLGFGSKTRLPEYPDVPTLAESGLPGYEAGSWYGLVAPRDTPRAIVDKINAETRRIFDDPQFRQKVLAPSFIYPIVSSPEDFAKRIRSDSEKWGKVIRAANIRVE
jgi:tripartite-type tricarboxylate transporter receptor subunit TctC